jgi:cysteine desulfurase/selenocysteine lyase
MSHPPRIYLDNAATSWPKPDAVYQAVDHYQRHVGAPAGRGVYREAAEVEREVARCRRDLAQLIGAADPRRIIFTLNATDALNLALHGLLRSGDHVVTTVVEHNSVLRPLRHLEDAGTIAVSRVGCDSQGVVSAEAIGQAMTERTRLVALIHASNVTGAIQPVEQVGRLVHQRDCLLLVDAAQTLGHLPVNVQALGADLLAAAGHKGLLGPLGSGLLYVAPGIENRLGSLRQGGTGTHSDLDVQPDSLPEKYEAGNLNVPAIVGLGAGLRYLAERGINQIRSHQRQLTDQLLRGLAGLPGVRIHGPADPQRQVGVVSMTLAGYDPRELASLLDASCSIQVRPGIHCAPRMHEALGTLRTGGTVRLSVGAFNTVDDIERAVEAIAEFASTSLD